MANENQSTGKKLSSRMWTVIWSLVVGVVIITLLYLERIDVLYILATLSLVALLIIVARANLEIGDGSGTNL